MIFAKNMMTPNVVTLHEKDVVWDAVNIMVNKNISCVVVVDDDAYPLGIITERDLIKRIMLPHKNPKKTLLGKVITRKLKYVKPEDDIHSIGIMMKENHIRRVLVLTGRKLLGIITETDVVNSAEMFYEQTQFRSDFKNYLIIVAWIIVLAFLFFKFLA